MRLGLSSIVGDGFGTGSFGIDGILDLSSYPPAGSYNSTLYGEVYPIAEGGNAVVNPENPAISYPNEVCDVDVLNNGFGGTYIDWSSATNVQFVAYGVLFYTSTNFSNSDIEVPSGSGNYYTAGSAKAAYYHDGSGSYYQDWVNQTWYSNGSRTNLSGADYVEQAEVPSGSETYYNTGRTLGYTWDGTGGYNAASVVSGSYYANGTQTGLTGLNVPSQSEVPSSSGNFYDNGTQTGYTWDGSGGYNYPVTIGSYYANGTDTGLTGLDVPNTTSYGGSGTANNGTSVGYTWDGSGGYNSGVAKGSYYPQYSTTNLIPIPTGMNTQTSVEVPTGNGVNYFDSEEEAETYEWDGSGGTTWTGYTWVYFAGGTFIYNDGTYDYYWNGTGGYYAI